jgi:hypothetical protein
MLGDTRRSRSLLEENLARAIERRNKLIEARSRSSLGMLAIEEGRIDESIEMLGEAYRLVRDVDERHQIAVGLCRFARALLMLGRAEAATKLLAKADLLRREIGLVPRSWVVTEAKCDETLSAARAQLDNAAFAGAWEQGLALSIDDAVAIATQDRSALLPVRRPSEL